MKASSTIGFERANNAMLAEDGWPSASPPA